MLCLVLLVERVDFHLIHHGTDTGKGGNVHHSVGIEIGDANSAELSGLIQVLQRPVGTIIIAKRLVQKHQIQIIRPQFSHGFQYGSLCLFIAIMLDPDLGRQKDFFPGNARFFNCIAYLFLIEIALGCIQSPVTCLQSVQNTALTDILRYLIDAVAQDRHFDSVW